MRILVDTPVWSDFLRRKSPTPEIYTEMVSLFRRGEAIIIGPIRQEVLSGLKSPTQFKRLKTQLKFIFDSEIETEDYENAAEYSNLCRSKGVQGSNTDFLACAVSNRLRIKIYTLDQDFRTFAKLLPISLYQP